MALQKVEVNILDGQVGVLSLITDAFVVVGVCQSGTKNAPERSTRDRDIIAKCGDGPATEAACIATNRFGLQPIICRTEDAVAGACSAITTSATPGTSIATIDAAVEPRLSADVIVQWVTGATVGVAGATYRYSISGGREWLPSKNTAYALGTATTFTLPKVNAKVNLAAGNIAAGRTDSFRATAPEASAADLDAALEAVELSAIVGSRAIIQIVGAVDATSWAIVVSRAASMEARGKYVRFVCHWRAPNIGETEAQYATAFATFKASISPNRRVLLCAADCKTVSAVSQQTFLFPPSYTVAPFLASVDWHVDISQKTGGFALPGVTVRDANGNRERHDEAIDPGLDDLGATVLQTQEGRGGVYVVNPRLFSGDGSDFQYAQHGRVMDAFCALVRDQLTDRLSRELLVDPVTGFILETEAAEVESTVTALAESLLAGKVSAVTFTLRRDDNVLSTGKLSGSGLVTPLAYPKSFGVDFAFNNPALRKQADAA